MIFVFLLFFFTIVKSQEEMIDIALVFSYELDFPVYQSGNAGIVDGLVQKGYYEDVNVRIHRFYMNTKTENTTPEKKRIIADKIIDELSNLPLSLLVLYDDNAFAYIGLEESSKIPIVFLGVNGRDYFVEENTENHGQNFTGVFERIFVNEALRVFSTILPDLTSDGTVLGIFDNTTTGNLIKREVGIELNSSDSSFNPFDHNIAFELITVSTMKDYQDLILNRVNKDEDIKAIYFMILSLQKDPSNPDKGSFGVIDIIRWTIMNCRKPEIGVEDYSEYGLFGGVGINHGNMGKRTGEMIGDVLNGRKTVNGIPIDYYSDGEIFFNYDRIEQLRPYIQIDDDKISKIMKLSKVYYGQSALENEILRPTEVEGDSLWWLSIIFGGLSVTIAFSFCCCLFLIVTSFCLISIFLSLFIMLITFDVYRLRFRQRKFNRIDDLDQVLIEQEERKIFNSGSVPRMKIDIDFFLIPYKDLQLKKVIGRGASDGNVFLAKWKKRLVAYKDFRIVKEVTDYEDFEKELLFHSSLHHPNILEFYGCVIDERRVGIVMQYAERGDLYKFIADKNLLEHFISLELKWKILRGIVGGMEYLHDRNVIHRDLKCKNVLLHNDEAKIIDFGLSKKLDVSNFQTKSIGTSLYMAPEITIGTEYDEKIDVFSFSIVMFVVLANTVRIYGDLTTMNGIEIKIAHDVNFRPQIPEKLSEDRATKWMVDLMETCWEHDSKKRPSFKEIREKFDSSETGKNYKPKRSSIVGFFG